MLKSIKAFLQMEAASGMVLIGVTFLALIAANSALAAHYQSFFTHTVHFIINDGLMTLFFLLVGMEIREETTNGSLATRAQAALPIAAAIGGVITPALIYSAFNLHTAAMRGWAVPSATDIAFSLGVLTLFGSRLPGSLKIFLMAVAVMDDLLAVLIIALFYTEDLSLVYGAGAALCALCIGQLSKRTQPKGWHFPPLGIAMWYCTWRAGIHPTIAGVVLGLLMPHQLRHRWVHRLHPWVAYGIMPLFAFANAGVSFQSFHLESLLHPVTAGITLGLLLGKPLGIAGVAWLLIRLKRANLPPGAGWGSFLAVCATAGIGFTMSLFITNLAFADSAEIVYSKLGVMVGSMASAVLGAWIWLTIRNKQPIESQTEE